MHTTYAVLCRRCGFAISCLIIKTIDGQHRVSQESWDRIAGTLLTQLRRRFLPSPVNRGLPGPERRHLHWVARYPDSPGPGPDGAPALTLVPLMAVAVMEAPKQPLEPTLRAFDALRVDPRDRLPRLQTPDDLGRVDPVPVGRQQ